MQVNRRYGGWIIVQMLACVGVEAAGADLRLVEAVKHQNTAAVRTLLAEGVDVDVSHPDGATPLAWAAHWDDLDTAALLLRAGANANAANDLGVTPLALACINGSEAMVDRLLGAGADPNAAPTAGETPLLAAARTGSAAVVKALLNAGAEVNAATTAARQTALMWAVAERHPDVVRVLIDAGADVHAHSTGGFTALLFAAQQGAVEAAEMLLDAGADVDDRASDDSTALLVATASGRARVTLLLLGRGADPNGASTGYTALHAAVLQNAVAAIGALLAQGAEPNARLTKAPAAIFGPSRGAGSEVLARVPWSGGRAGAGPAARQPGSLSGATPFWLAARSVNAPVMQALVDGGADPTLTTDDGTTPLMVAAGLTQVQGPRARRGDVSSFYSNWGERDSLEAVALLARLGADLNATNRADQTALHGAAYMGGGSVARFLVDRGAGLNAQDAQGQTPYRIAEGHLNVAGQGVTEWPETAALLRQRGADVSLGVDVRILLRRYDDDTTTEQPTTETTGSVDTTKRP